MKTILIIGDSWGVPNYTTSKIDLAFVKKTNEPPETHTEYLLKDTGYKVYNCSLNGGSNCKTINLARKFLNGERVVLEPRHVGHNLNHSNIKTSRGPTYSTTIDKDATIDVIIWFHTDFFRGPYYDPAKNINDNIKYSAEKNYLLAADLFKQCPNAKIIVIGGQSPVYTEVLYDYITPDYLIQDWRSEIIGTKLPEVYTLSTLSIVEKSPDTLDFKLDLLEKHQIIMDAMRNSPDFPDNRHPGTDAHKKLTERLIKFIEESDSEDQL
jgi:hypothetical protein